MRELARISSALVIGLDYLDLWRWPMRRVLRAIASSSEALSNGDEHADDTRSIRPLLCSD